MQYYFSFLSRPMDSVLCNILFLGISLILGCGVSADPCERSNPCQCFKPGGDNINLESLALNNNTARFRQKYKDSGVVSFNPCKSFNGEDECREAAACFQEKGEYSSVIHSSIFGKQDTAKWTEREEKYLIITYNYTDRIFAVSLVCNETADDSLTVTDISGTTIKAELTSKCACPGLCPIGSDPTTPSKHSISTGSIILILFFTLVLLYLVGGVIYNKIVNGATGKELIPNVEFWASLPKLVLDGVAFTCNCCGKRRTTPGYDNV